MNSENSDGIEAAANIWVSFGWDFRGVDDLKSLLYRSVSLAGTTIGHFKFRKQQRWRNKSWPSWIRRPLAGFICCSRHYLTAASRHFINCNSSRSEYSNRKQVSSSGNKSTDLWLVLRASSCSHSSFPPNLPPPPRGGHSHRRHLLLDKLRKILYPKPNPDPINVKLQSPIPAMCIQISFPPSLPPNNTLYNLPFCIRNDDATERQKCEFDSYSIRLADPTRKF